MPPITQQRCTTCQYATIGLYDVTVKAVRCCAAHVNTHTSKEVPWMMGTTAVGTSHYSLPTVACITPPHLACGKQPKAPVAR
jgi:hypothetical protein